MSTTDSNGLVVLDENDPIVPYQGIANTVTASVSAAFDLTVRTFKVANQAARNALATQRPPAPDNPLQVWRVDKKYFEINDGSGWKSWSAEPNSLFIDGQKYQRSGIVTNIPQNPDYTKFGDTYVRTIAIPPPFTPPDGWFFSFECLETTGYTTVTNSIPFLVDGTVRLRITQVGSSDVSALKRLYWELRVV